MRPVCLMNQYQSKKKLRVAASTSILAWKCRLASGLEMGDVKEKMLDLQQALVVFFPVFHDDRLARFEIYPNDQRGRNAGENGWQKRENGVKNASRRKMRWGQRFFRGETGNWLKFEKEAYSLMEESTSWSKMSSWKTEMTRTDC